MLRNIKKEVENMEMFLDELGTTLAETTAILEKIQDESYDMNMIADIKKNLDRINNLKEEL